ncbi:MAG: sugar ABC transporter ATP-binding protein [Clostridia bacterium]|nr:sugar ABC transporter ATP-binding protein [Clostridia bacterium]
MQTILEMRGITKYIFDSYGIALRNTTVKILDRVNFDLRKGEVHILVGENGAGKSTLMKVLGGIIPPDEGEMLLDGANIRPRNAREAQNLGIGFIHQELNLCGNLSVCDNIYMGREIKKGVFRDKKAMLEKSRALLTQLGIDISPSTLVRDLSTAQQQIVEIAKVLSYDCRVIIMDEPTSSLTKKEIDILFRLIHRLKADGVSIIYISHRLEEFDIIGDRLSVLRDGAYIGTLEREEFSVDKIVRMMVGRQLGQMYQNTHVPGKQTVLEVKDLRLEAHTSPISINVKAGEIVGMGGLVGAGRTELAKSIIGYRKSFGGEITYLGKAVHHPDPASLIKDGLIYLTEDRKTEGLILDMGIDENLTLASLKLLYKRFFMFGGAEDELARDMVKKLNIVCNSYNQKARTLSGGNQQKVVLGKCLAAKPQMLILDEPTRGIDVGAKTEIYHMMDEIAKSGVAIMMISSDMPELIGMSDRIYVMRDGAVAAEITERERMTQEIILEYTIKSRKEEAR